MKDWGFLGAALTYIGRATYIVDDFGTLVPINLQTIATLRHHWLE